MAIPAIWPAFREAATIAGVMESMTGLVDIMAGVVVVDTVGMGAACAAFA